MRRSCSVNCHFPCAVETQGWAPAALGITVNPFVCKSKYLDKSKGESTSYGRLLKFHHRLHTVHRTEIETNEDIRVDDLNSDLSCGREAVMVACEGTGTTNKIGESAEDGPEAFTYISRLIDSDNCAIVSGPRDLKVCCDCPDICMDPKTCACLRRVS